MVFHPRTAIYNRELSGLFFSNCLISSHCLHAAMVRLFICILLLGICAAQAYQLLCQYLGEPGDQRTFDDQQLHGLS